MPTPTTIRVYSTLTKEKTPFETVRPGRVGIYLCGPTVYKPSHIGHMVGPVIFDTIKRFLRYCGYEVTLVINVTDVDDKLINESRTRGMTMAALAEEMTSDYMRNLQAMGVDTVDHFPRATLTMDGIVRFTEGLIEKGFAYASEGDVYFDVAKDREYGKLSNRSLKDMQGEGGEMAGRKRSPYDFALWKSAKPGEPSWPSPWGNGRPGWHIECSAMSHAILGETFDIHGGGLDLVFPHHENEIAQSECFHGKPQARYWLHNGLMQAADEVGKVGGRQTREAGVAGAERSAAPAGAPGAPLRSAPGTQAPGVPAPTAGDFESQQAGKISKSKGSGPFSELLKHHSPEAIRMLLISTHYRSPILFSEGEIRTQAERLETFYRFFKRYQRVTGEAYYTLAAPSTRAEGDALAGPSGAPSHDEGLAGQLHDLRVRFLERMDDDFNTAGAIGCLFEAVNALNRYVEAEKLETDGNSKPHQLAALKRGAAILRELGNVVGLFHAPPAKPAGAGDALTNQLMQLLIDLRAEARKAKNFALADRIRNGLTEIGITLEDRAGATEWSWSS
jgi:cysteinyl-tRNA synthetase